ncbi:hypothetical protein ES707_16731 [subsurface metagenome]
MEGTPDDIEKEIHFYIENYNGTLVLALNDPTRTFESGADPQEVDLIFEGVQLQSPAGDGVGAPTYYTETNLFGTEKSFRIDSNGKILRTIEATSANGMLTITIPEGTIALNRYGKRLKSFETAVDESPPDPPEDAHIIGLPYRFGPDGATFDPEITFTWSYDPDALPEDVAEEDLVLAYYDEAADEWVELDCVVDTKNNVITASVEHFTTFSIIGTVMPPPPAAFSVTNLSVRPAEVEPKEAVTITVWVANTGGTEGSYGVVLKIDEVREAEKSVTVAAGESQVVTFSVTREQAGTYDVMVAGLGGSFTVVAAAIVPPPAPAPAPAPVPAPAPAPAPAPVPAPAPEPAPETNWLLIGGIIAAAVVVGLLIFWLVRRRA